jgi:predicted nucleic acid-binding protein
MRFLLDTNFLSEGMKRRPDAGVVAWGLQQSPLDLFVSVLSLGEIRKGIELSYRDDRRGKIENWLTNTIPLQFRGRILPVNEEIALEWGRLSADGQSRGRVLPSVDGLLVATAIVHGMTLVTRNERDCANRGALTLNPWTG